MGGKHTSLRDAVRQEKESIDNVHKELFQKVEYSLHSARHTNLKEFKEFDGKINQFIKTSLVENHELFEHSLHAMLELAKNEKLQDCARYEEIFSGWKEIVGKMELEVPTAVRNHILSHMDTLLLKQQQISGFQFEKEVLSELEDSMYEEKILRDNCYKELLVQIANAIKLTNQKLHHKYSGSTYKIENEVNVKDKEFQYKSSVEILQKFDALFDKTVENDTELMKQKQTITELYKKNKENMDKNHMYYNNMITSIIQEDQHWIDYEYDEVLSKIKVILKEYKYRLDYIKKEMPNKLLTILKNGDNLLYQNYRTMKYEIFDLINHDIHLPNTYKHKLINEMIAYRRMYKLSHESIISTQHNQLSLKVHSYYDDEDNKYIDNQISEIFMHITHVLEQDKGYLDMKHKHTYHQLVELMKKDQEMLEIKEKDFITKMDKLYPIGSTTATVHAG